VQEPFLSSEQPALLAELYNKLVLPAVRNLSATVVAAVAKAAASSAAAAGDRDAAIALLKGAFTQVEKDTSVRDHFNSPRMQCCDYLYQSEHECLFIRNGSLLS